jgi:predicted enzyme related to lactoylglutathione lyase
MKYRVFSAAVMVCAGAFTLAALTSMVGCRKALPRVSAVSNSPSGQYEPGRFVWHDLMTHDLRAVKGFYGGLFGWEFEEVPDGEGVYTTILHDGKPVGGIIVLKKANDEIYSQWLSYVSVEDVDDEAGSVKNHGGEVYRKPLDLPDRGRVAVVLDNQGSFLGLLRATGGDPVLEEPVYGEWMWHELWTDDVHGSMGFYESMFEHKRDNIKIGEYDYGVLAKDGKLRAGVVKIPYENVEPNWLPYIAVSDPSAVGVKATELGGKVLIESEETGANRAVIIADPSGAVFGVHIWPLPDNIRREGE